MPSEAPSSKLASPGQRHRLRDRHHRVLRRRAPLALPGREVDPHALADPGLGDALADRLDDARPVLAGDLERERDVAGVPGAGLPVGRVHARDREPHEHLAGARRRRGDLADGEHVRPAGRRVGRGDHDSSKNGSPGFAYSRARSTLSVTPRPGRVRNADLAAVDHRPVPAGREVVPERHAHAVPLEREEVRDRGADVDVGDRPDRRRDAVRRHRDVVRVGVVGDPARLEQPAGLLRVGRGDVDRAALERLAEAVAHVAVLAGGDRRRGRGP